VTALAALAATGTNLAAGVFPAGPDAVPIGLCAEMDTVGRRIAALPGHQPSGLPDLALQAATNAACRIKVDQHPVLEALRLASTLPYGLRGQA